MLPIYGNWYSQVDLPFLIEVLIFQQVNKFSRKSSFLHLEVLYLP